MVISEKEFLAAETEFFALGQDINFYNPTCDSAHKDKPFKKDYPRYPIYWEKSF